MKDPLQDHLEHDLSYHELVGTLLGLPHKILKNHEVDGLAQMVLHELGHRNHLGLDKATYLIDNPDFDCLQGVAGFCSDECKFHKQDMWEEPHTFAEDMSAAEFHQNMKNFLRHGLKRKDINIHDEADLQELGTKLGLKNPAFMTWPMRHGNHGILLFESNDSHAGKKLDLLHSASGFLSLCPIER